MKEQFKQMQKGEVFMEMLSIEKELQGNSYPGRGIIIGRSEDGTKAVTAYFIMGRSANSRNRIFAEEGEGIRTQAFDESKLEDPSLIIYAPVRVLGNKTIVTNGDQTDTIEAHLKAGKCFRRALTTRCFEPDAPNFTPRISGILHLDGAFAYELSILKSADEKGSACNRYTFDYEPLNGVGHFIHTYVTDGNPLPTFTGEPERVSIPNDVKAFAEEVWNNLCEENKISLVCRYTDIKSGKFEQVTYNKHEVRK